jgi:ABC-2 type transport system permease protein
MDKIKTIIRKEWAEVFKNKMVLFSVIFMPLIFAVLPLAILYSTGGAAQGDIGGELPSQFSAFCSEGMDSGECFQVYIVSQFIFLFMLVPLIIPVNIAAYSIVGEKTTRSLEPLLATPISTWELLIAKNLAAVIPAVLATLVGFMIFAVGAGVISSSPAVTSALLDPLWLLAVILIGPMLAVLSVNFAIMVSSRVNDPRVAEQLSVVVIVQVLVVFFGQISGLILLNQQMVVVLSALLILLDAALIYFAVRMFQRENILTRWK